MDAQELLAVLLGMGVRVVRQGDGIALTGKTDSLDLQDIRFIRSRKGELLAHLERIEKAAKHLRARIEAARRREADRRGRLAVLQAVEEVIDGYISRLDPLLWDADEWLSRLFRQWDGLEQGDGLEVESGGRPECSAQTTCPGGTHTGGVER